MSEPCYRTWDERCRTHGTAFPLHQGRCDDPSARPDERQAGLREALNWLNDIEMTDNGDGRSLLSPAEYRKYERAVDILAALAAQVPAQEERLDVDRLARAYAEAGYGPALTDDEWADIAAEYRALGGRVR